MEAKILCTKNTSADRDIEWLSRKLGELRVNHRLIDADSREGASISELYDVLDRPAVIVTRSDGSLVSSWQGELPTPQDVSNAVNS